MKRCVIITLLLLATSVATLAQTAERTLAQGIDQLFAQWNKPDSPGAAVIVVKDGAVLYQRGYGSADLEHNAPITPATVFQIASVSKQFTTFAIVLLAQQGKLSLDDDVRQHIAEFPDFGARITIRHLIHHTSGLREERELLRMSGRKEDDALTHKDVMQLVRQAKELNFAPGEQFAYCNTNYALLAEIVARVSRQSFRQFCDEQIFKPLGMTSTHVHDDYEEVVKQRAHSYRPTRNSFKLTVSSSARIGSTNVYTMVEDLAKWVMNFETAQVGGKAAIEQMKQQGMLNNGSRIAYAGGLFIESYKGLPTVSHSGSDASYRSFLLHFPAQKFGVVVLCNLGAVEPRKRAYEIADIVLAEALAKSAAAPKPVYKADPRTFDAFVGTYVMDPAFLVNITREGEKLFASSSQLPKTEMTPEAETTFYLQPADARIVFRREKDGSVNRYQLLSAEDLSAVRVNLITLHLEQLQEFAGNYFCPELQTTYTLTVKDGKLTAQMPRGDDAAMTPIGTDHFLAQQSWLSGRLQFTRNAANKINGFRFSSNRIKNLRFEKQGVAR